MIVLIFETFPVTSSFTPFQRWRCFYSKVDIKHLFNQFEKRRTMYVHSGLEDYVAVFVVCFFIYIGVAWYSCYSKFSQLDYHTRFFYDEDVFVGLCYSKVDIKHLFSQLEKRRTTQYTVEWKITSIFLVCLFLPGEVALEDLIV